MQINKSMHVVLTQNDGERIWSKRERREGTLVRSSSTAVEQCTLRLSQTKPGSGYCIRSDPASDARRLSAFYIPYLYSGTFLIWDMFLCEEPRSQLTWWLVYTRFSMQRYISRPIGNHFSRHSPGLASIYRHLKNLIGSKDCAIT